MKTTCTIIIDDNILFENIKATITIYNDPYPQWTGRLFFNKQNISVMLSVFKPYDIFDIELADGQKGKFKITKLESSGCEIIGRGLLA